MTDDYPTQPRGLRRAKSETFEDLRDMGERVAVLETTTGAHDDALAELGKKRPTPWTSIVLMVAAILFPIGSLIFAAGHYPDRGEFEDAKNRGEQRMEDLRKDLAEVQREQVRARTQTDALVDSQTRVEKKLDVVISSHRR